MALRRPGVGVGVGAARARRPAATPTPTLRRPYQQQQEQQAAAAAAVAATLLRSPERVRTLLRDEQEEEADRAAPDAGVLSASSATSALRRSLLLEDEEQEEQPIRRPKRAPPDLSPAAAADRARALELRAAASLQELGAAAPTTTPLGPRASAALATRAAALLRRNGSSSATEALAAVALPLARQMTKATTRRRASASLLPPLDPIGAALVLQALGSIASGLNERDGAAPPIPAQVSGAAAAVASAAAAAVVGASSAGPAQLAQASWGAAQLLPCRELAVALNDEAEEPTPAAALTALIKSAAARWVEATAANPCPSARDCAQMAEALRAVVKNDDTITACARLLCAQMAESLDASQGLAPVAAVASSAAALALPPSSLPPLLSALLPRCQAEFLRLVESHSGRRHRQHDIKNVARLGAIAQALATLLRAQRRAAAQGGGSLGAAPAKPAAGWARDFEAALQVAGAFDVAGGHEDQTNTRLLALGSAAALLSELKRWQSDDSSPKISHLLVSAATRLLPLATTDPRPVLSLAAHVPRLLSASTSRPPVAFLAALSDAAERTKSGTTSSNGASVLAGCYAAWRRPPASESLRRQLARAVLDEKEGDDDQAASAERAAKTAWALARAGVRPTASARRRFFKRFFRGNDGDDTSPLVERMGAEAVSWAFGAAAVWVEVGEEEKEEEGDDKAASTAAAWRRMQLCLTAERRRRRRLPTAALARFAAASVRLGHGGGGSRDAAAAFGAACEDAFLPPRSQRCRPCCSSTSTLHLSTVLLASQRAGEGAIMPKLTFERLARELARRLEAEEGGGGGNGGCAAAALRALLLAVGGGGSEAVRSDLILASLAYAQHWAPNARARALDAVRWSRADGSGGASPPSSLASASLAQAEAALSVASSCSSPVAEDRWQDASREHCDASVSAR
jgi:hypothetical protein